MYCRDVNRIHAQSPLRYEYFCWLTSISTANILWRRHAVWIERLK